MTAGRCLRAARLEADTPAPLPPSEPENDGTGARWQHLLHSACVCVCVSWSVSSSLSPAVCQVSLTLPACFDAEQRLPQVFPVTASFLRVDLSGRTEGAAHEHAVQMSADSSAPPQHQEMRFNRILWLNRPRRRPKAPFSFDISAPTINKSIN